MDGPEFKFNETSLPQAIASLFRMNNYDVELDIHRHGAQVDMVAIARGDPFANPIYIEATIEYVDNNKYGKDSTKFLLLRQKEPGCKLLCISSAGFTANVKERAAESGIETLTYDELFRLFEKFSPYIDHVLDDGEQKVLHASYEEPFFNDPQGREAVIPWLNRWRGYKKDEQKWLLVLGEYGTGKTALTKILQYRWLSQYKDNPSTSIPIRIELKNFSRQFDANGLLPSSWMQTDYLTSPSNS